MGLDVANNKITKPVAFQCLDPKNKSEGCFSAPSAGHWRGARSALRIPAEHRAQDGRHSGRDQRPRLPATGSGTDL